MKLNKSRWFTTGIACSMVVGLAMAGCADSESDSTVPVESVQETVSIFNGMNLEGWDGDPRFWRVEDGVIIGETTLEEPTERNTFLFWAGGEPGNFELEFDIRCILVHESGYCNTGVQVRSERFTDPDNENLIWRARGYQPDFANSDWIPGIMHGEGGLGTRVHRGERVLLDEEGERNVVEEFATQEELGEFIHEHSEWNRYRIVANGDTIRSWINGHLMHELVDVSPEARRDGVIAFQVHAGNPMRVEFRNVDLTMLP